MHKAILMCIKIFISTLPFFSVKILNLILEAINYSSMHQLQSANRAETTNSI